MPFKNGDNTKEDLVRQIIKYDFPVPEQPPEGLGPPHLYVTIAPNPVRNITRTGRDSLDAHGWRKWSLEFYIICITLDTGNYDKSQKAMYTLVNAVRDTLGKNRRLITPGGAGTDPMAYDLETLDVPFNLNSTENLLLARNVLTRIDVLVNLRP